MWYKDHHMRSCGIENLFDVISSDREQIPGQLTDKTTTNQEQSKKVISTFTGARKDSGK